MTQTLAEIIRDAQTSLGIEFGSTRIKAVLIGPGHEVLASGSHTWENQYVDHRWTYSLEAIETGLQDAYAALAADVQERYGETLTRIGSMGISAMMHGYMPFNAAGELLVPFRTWRNTSTLQASTALSALFNFNMPQRWSGSHIYQAILDGEEHVTDLDFMTTLAGYVHWRLSGRKVLGVGDASGMFPIDETTGTYNTHFLDLFDEAVADRALPWRIADVLPEVLGAGTEAGALTEDGARFLDPTGTLEAGIPLCPPEGDAGTGMVATNAVRPGTGNTSVGTSIFAMIVLEKALSRMYPELDVVTTPDGAQVAMVHCNNGADEMGKWCALFGEFAAAAGLEIETAQVFDALFKSALNAAPDGGGLTAYNFVSGEDVVGLLDGAPLILRTSDSKLSLANLMRTHIFSTFAALRIGMDVLAAEDVHVQQMLAHGGVFTTPLVAQKLLAAAIDTPVAVPAAAPEGGAWGMAVLAAYLREGHGKSFPDYLDSEVFAGQDVNVCAPDPVDVEGFQHFLTRFHSFLPVERAAVDAWKAE